MSCKYICLKTKSLNQIKETYSYQVEYNCINLYQITRMAIHGVEFSSEEYKIGNVFA